MPSGGGTQNLELSFRVWSQVTRQRVPRREGIPPRVNGEWISDKALAPDLSANVPASPSNGKLPCVVTAHTASESPITSTPGTRV